MAITERVAILLNSTWMMENYLDASASNLFLNFILAYNSWGILNQGMQQIANCRQTISLIKNGSSSSWGLHKNDLI